MDLNFFTQPQYADRHLFSSVMRLSVSFADPVKGTVVRTSCTGFSIQIGNVNWIITNRHCLDVNINPRLKGLLLSELKVIYAAKDFVIESKCEWICDLKNVRFKFCSTTDLAAFPFSSLSGGGIWTQNFSSDFIADESLFATIRVGSNIEFIGYPAKLWDSHNFLPIMRSASISSIPSYDYGISGQEREPRVLVNGMSLGGGSGSPVLYETKGNGYKLIGIMSGHYFKNQQWDSEVEVDSEATQSDAHSGLSYLIKAPILKELMKWPEFDRYSNNLSEA